MYAYMHTHMYINREREKQQRLGEREREKDYGVKVHNVVHISMFIYRERDYSVYIYVHNNDYIHADCTIVVLISL